MELAPQRIDVFLLVIHACVFHQVVPSGGMCSIGSDEKVEGYFYLFVSCPGRGFGARGCEPGFACLEIGAGELMVEVEGYVWEGFELV